MMETSGQERVMISLESATYIEWRRIGKTEGIQDDLNISKFLIRMYDRTKNGDQTSVHCLHCGKLTSLLCSFCRSKPQSQTLPADEKTELPLRPESSNTSSDGTKQGQSQWTPVSFSRTVKSALAPGQTHRLAPKCTVSAPAPTQSDVSSGYLQFSLTPLREENGDDLYPCQSVTMETAFSEPGSPSLQSSGSPLSKSLTDSGSAPLSSGSASLSPGSASLSGSAPVSSGSTPLQSGSTCSQSQEAAVATTQFLKTRPSEQPWSLAETGAVETRPLEQPWSLAETGALARYIKKNKMKLTSSQVDKAWSECAAFLNTAFATSRTGEACRQQTEQQRLLFQREETGQVGATGRKRSRFKRRQAETVSSDRDVGRGKLDVVGLDGGWTSQQVAALERYVTERSQERHTRRFWMDCADMLNASFDSHRTVASYREKYNKQKWLTSDPAPDQTVVCEVEVIADTNSHNSTIRQQTPEIAQTQMAAICISEDMPQHKQGQLTSDNKEKKGEYELKDEFEGDGVMKDEVITSSDELPRPTRFLQRVKSLKGEDAEPAEPSALDRDFTSTTDSRSKGNNAAVSEPGLIYIGVEDLDVQLPSKDHNYIHRQRQQQHMTSAEDIYLCKVCGRSFEKRHRLISHIRYVHCDWRPFLCQRCPSAFQSKSRLQRHVYVVHTKERPYRCHVCAAAFVDQFGLNSHKVVHQENRCHRYFCELCGKGYHGLKGLKKHLLSHSPGQRPPTNMLLCWICGKAVASTTYLKLHLKKHSPDTAIRCSVCCQIFTSKQVLQKHLKSRVHQKRVDEKNSLCEGEEENGGKQENSDVGASKQRKRHVKTGAFKCEICEKLFSSKKSKKRHKRTIHHCDSENESVKFRFYLREDLTQKDLAPCGQGGFSAADKDATGCSEEAVSSDTGIQVTDHNALTVTSTQKKPETVSRKFTCDICFQQFSLQQSVRRHKRNVHFKRRDYVCDVCHKSFTDSYYLKQHKQIHHNAGGRLVRQTVRCDVCDKSFMAKSAMTMHKRTVHYGLRRQSCFLCGKKFRDKFTLERHGKSCRRQCRTNQVERVPEKLDTKTAFVATGPLNIHTRPFETHSSLVDGHTRSVDGHTRSVDGHTRLVDGHTRSVGRHAHSLDGHTRLSDGCIHSSSGLLLSSQSQMLVSKTPLDAVSNTSAVMTSVFATPVVMETRPATSGFSAFPTISPWVGMPPAFDRPTQGESQVAGSVGHPALVTDTDIGHSTLAAGHIWNLG